MKSYLSGKLLLGFLASIGIMCALGIGSFFYVLRVIEYSRIGGQSHQVLLLTEEICAIASQRELFKEKLLQGPDEGISRKYTGANLTLQSKLRELDSITRNYGAQAALVSELKAAAGSGSAVVSYGSPSSGLEVIDRLTKVATAIKSLEQDARSDRLVMVTDQFFQFAFTFGGLVLLGLVIPFTLAIALNKNLKRRSEYEEKLASATQTVKDLYDNAPCGYFSLNADGIFTHANKTIRQWLGYTQDELVDRLHFKDLFSAEPGILERLDLTSLRNDSGVVLGVEVMVARKDGTRFPVSINCSAIKDAHNDAVSSRCTMFDLTELKRAEEEIRRTNRELEAFSNSISHDLRAPLRSIGGFAKILLEDYSDKLDREGNSHLSRISTNAVQMSQLIEDLLDFTKVGKREMSKSRIELDDFIRNVSRELVHLKEERKISIHIHPMGSCLADEGMLRQAWMSLISNAIKYSGKHERPQIEIGRTIDNGEAVFFIKDNGVGFDMKLSDRLFGVFQRLHRKEDFEGTGVGLAMVKRIVERHNGRVWADSRLNEGATFYFTLGQN